MANIDNPGNGNCAYYSYSIGLIDIIQRELEKDMTSPTFNNWCELNPDIKSFLPEIQTFNFQNQDGKLLDKLQLSLRQIIVSSQKNALQECVMNFDLKNDDQVTAVLSNDVYQKFAEIVYAYQNRAIVDNRYNELALSNDVKFFAYKISKSLKNTKKFQGDDFKKREIFNNLVVVYHFVKNILKGDNSSIISALNTLQKNHYWGTHHDLNVLSHAFDINFLYTVDGDTPYPFVLKHDRPQIIINNHANGHWTTTIERSDDSFKKQVNSTKKNTQELICNKSVSEFMEELIQKYKSGFFNISKDKQISLKDINTAQALENETDEQFAERLQEAHLRLSGFTKS